MGTVLGPHGLTSAPKVLAGPGNLRGVQVGCHGGNGGLQGTDTAVIDCTGLLQSALQVVVAGGSCWASWRTRSGCPVGDGVGVMAAEVDFNDGTPFALLHCF